MAVLEKAMPRPKRKPGEPAEQSAKIAVDVLKMARVIVAAKGGSVSKVISDYCRPHFVKVVKQILDSGELLPPGQD